MTWKGTALLAACLAACSGSSQEDSACCEDGSGTTGPEALEPVAEEDVRGRTYAMDIADVQWNEPSRGDEVLGPVPGVRLWEVLTVSGPTLTMRWAGGETEDKPDPEITQELCDATQDMPSFDFSANPEFEMTTSSFTLVHGDRAVKIYDWTVSGVFSEDGTEIRRIQGKGLAYAPDFTFFAGDDPCGGQFECVDCPNGTEQCVEFSMSSGEAYWVPDLTLTERSLEDVECDGSCGVILDPDSCP